MKIICNKALFEKNLIDLNCLWYFVFARADSSMAGIVT